MIMVTTFAINVIGNKSVLMVNDKNISKEMFSTIKDTIDKKRLFIFYIETAQD